MPYHNPVVLASEIAVADILLDGRYEFGVGRGHGWMPPKAGIAADTGVARALRGVGRAALHGARERALLLRRQALPGRRLGDRAAAGPQVPRLPRRHLRPHVRARRRARLGRRRAAAAAVRRPRRAARPLPREVRRARHRAGHRLDPRLLHRRGPGGREARGGEVDGRLPAGQRLAADGVRPAAGGRAERGRLRLLHRRHPREAGADAVRRDDRRATSSGSARRRT